MDHWARLAFGVRARSVLRELRCVDKGDFHKG